MCFCQVVKIVLVTLVLCRLWMWLLCVWEVFVLFNSLIYEHLFVTDNDGNDETNRQVSTIPRKQATTSAEVVRTPHEDAHDPMSSKAVPPVSQKIPAVSTVDPIPPPKIETGVSRKLRENSSRLLDTHLFYRLDKGGDWPFSYEDQVKIFIGHIEDIRTFRIQIRPTLSWEEFAVFLLIEHMLKFNTVFMDFTLPLYPLFTSQESAKEGGQRQLVESFVFPARQCITITSPNHAEFLVTYFTLDYSGKPTTTIRRPFLGSPDQMVWLQIDGLTAESVTVMERGEILDPIEMDY